MVRLIIILVLLVVVMCILGIVAVYRGVSLKDFFKSILVTKDKIVKDFSDAKKEAKEEGITPTDE